MNDEFELYEQLLLLQADRWVEQLPMQLASAFSPGVHSELPVWQRLIAELPAGLATQTKLATDSILIGDDKDLSAEQQQQLRTTLHRFHPWRKGPFTVYGIHIDTEWRSDWKWRRLEGHISDLSNRVVLDVGCGNGYHCWRMLGAGAKLVIGIDPLLLNVLQFKLLKTLYGTAPVYVLPIGIEALPSKLALFDSVFSMGVLYHRRSPIDHLLELRDCLQPGGELILETLIIEGKGCEVLLPEARYANMRNVWFIPTISALLSWLTRCGYKNARVVDVTRTSTEEQRRTEWMHFNSLQDYLDPENSNLTREGLPAPIRAVFIANT